MADGTPVDDISHDNQKLEEKATELVGEYPASSVESLLTWNSYAIQQLVNKFPSTGTSKSSHSATISGRDAQVS
jgi:hypothetical protein